ncbi:unnamed protein product [Ectocarpus sp. 12 AP-2014]
MAKFITQETFDEVVKENMEDFDMDRESAARDAVGQFNAQGADLSNVDTSADGVRRDARAAIKDHVERLRGFDLNDRGKGEGVPTSGCLEALSSVGNMCREEGAAGESNRTAVGEAGGVGAIARFLGGDADESPPSGVVLAALNTLQDVCKNSERNRDAFIYRNMDQLTSLLVRWTNTPAPHTGSRSTNGPGDGAVGDSDAPVEGTVEPEPISGDAESMDKDKDQDKALLVAAGLKTVRIVCTKAENNKGSFMRRKGADILVETLRRYGAGEGRDATVTREACAALRSLTLADDRRKDFSGTYDNVKALVSAGVIPLLLEAARASEEDSITLSPVFLALKQLAANDESVKLIVENGGLDLVSGAVVAFPQEAVVCRTALSLFRNISANDILKTRLLHEGGLMLVLGCMAQHQNDKTLQATDMFTRPLAEHGCATMAAMSLRSPPNGAQIVREGGITAVVQAMRRHPTVQPLQRQACLCIRNIAARGPSLRTPMLDEGCEPVLREAGKLRGCVDEAYGALRDLQCEVGLVTMGESGKVHIGVTAFGEEKPNFNPSLQETKDLGERIEGSATAPAHSGHRL